MIRTKASLIALLLMTLFVACKQTPNCERSEEEQWKMGWRMVDSNWDENYVLALEQFDSLRQCPEGLSLEFLCVGLNCLEELGEKEKLRDILGELDQEMIERFSWRGLYPEELAEISSFVRPPFTHPELREELLKMFIDDQYCRGNSMADIKTRFNLEGYKPYDADRQVVDAKNQLRLKAILDEHGFPTRKMVGGTAIRGAFMIIQHAGGDGAWQQSQLPKVKAAVLKGDMDGQKYALLYDRIQLRNGDKQLFGTQARLAEDGVNLKLEPLEDPENLDKRRRAMGMCPIDMYIEVLKSR